MRRRRILECVVLCLAGVCGGGYAETVLGEDSDMVSISASVVEIGKDGTRQIIAQPNLVVSIGKWATFKNGGEMMLPTEFTLPNIPEELASDAKIKGAVDGEPKWKTNRSSVVIPSHPKVFESQSHGLTMKFRPRLDEKGKLVVDCEMEQKTFEGFVNYGNSITVEKKKAGGKSKTQVLTRDSLLLPAFHTRFQKTIFLPTDSGLVPKVLEESVEPKEKEGKVAAIEVSVRAKRLEKLKPSPKKSIPKKARIYVTMKVIESPSEIGMSEGVPEPLSSGVSILTDPQFQVMIRALNQEKGVDLLSAPSIMLEPGQKGNVEVVKDFIYPENYDPPEFPEEASAAVEKLKKGEGISFPVTPAVPTEFATTQTGVAIELLGRVLSDGRIELELEPGVTEFTGFTNFGQPIVYLDKNALGKTREIIMSENRIEMPSFQKRSVKTTVRIPDNATVVLGGLIREEIQDVEDKIPVLGDLPLIGRFGRSTVELHIKRHLYFAIKAQLVDAAGGRIE